MEQIYSQIVSMSHAHFEEKPVTPETIRDYIKRAKSFYPEHEIDEKKLFNLLEAVHSPSINEDAGILENNEAHEEWFNPDTNLPLHKDFNWHYWDHYRQFLLLKKKWPAQIVGSLDRFSSLVLSRMEAPERDGPWDRRGMVVGNVQSGKTANYTALITKAADAGYKLFVILAGVHNSLRSQTQERLNEEFLGYDLDVIQRITGQERRIGVRRMFPNHRVVNTLTSSADKGDFRRAVANQAGIIPSLTGDPIILIVKKHVAILRNLIEWATSLGQIDNQGRRVVQDIPFLLIDDECDYASVNTRKPIRDEYGKIVEDWDPAKTNMRIRQLLSSFSKSIYVGYTATPYANIFIHKDDPHPQYGEDLFPKHFLISLPQPTNYVGPEEVFGLRDDPDVAIQAVTPLPLVREVDDSETFIPGSHNPSLSVNELPGSLKNSIKAFLLVCAARRIRVSGVVHNSMLVHVTRFTRVQGLVRDLIGTELTNLTARIMSGSDSLDDFREIWEEDFLSTSLEMKSRGFKDSMIHDWDEVRLKLLDAVRSIRLKGINGEIGDTLDYRLAEARTRERIENGEEVPWEEKGISVIAIGGDKLSRGLTLDGLSVSYYLRAARMYDTLMQMGRWFGYREGYNDLCRIYTTGELIEWYRHIALANRELKNEFDYMEMIGSSPEKFGLKVRNHPGRLAITSAGKSRATERMRINFAGRCHRTIVFNPQYSAANIDAVEKLISGIGREPDRKFDEKKPRYYWKGVSPDLVVTFLNLYTTQDDAKRIVDPARMGEYIEKQIPRGELTDWHVVMVSNVPGKAVHNFKIGKYNVLSVLRKPLRPVTKDIISIGTLTSPIDEYIDFTKEEYDALKKLYETRGGSGEIDEQQFAAFARQRRPETRGLILIYFPACNDEKDARLRYGLAGNEVVGFAISFPGSDTAEDVDYIVNSVFSED
ncbi:Z1 domain-containing protein [Thermodesulfobacteriota bacterium]